MSLSVKVHRLNPEARLPTYQTAGAAGFDLAASAETSVEPGQVVLVPTGLVIAVPEGHFLAIFARSSTPLKKGLMVANGVGVVDSDYCGPRDEIKIEVFNFTPNTVTVRAGDRLAQGVLVPFARADWREQSAVDGPTRGGFGATG